MNRIIVVTGSAGGIGSATCDVIERNGDKVIRCDIKDADIICDVSTPEGRAEMCAKVAELAPGYIDGVATWAGVSPDKGTTLAINYFGSVGVVEGLHDLLVKSEAPRVCLTSSRSSLYGDDPICTMLCLRNLEEEAVRYAEETVSKTPIKIYATSKVAIARWVRRNAGLPRWGGSGILVNCIHPGLVKTPMGNKWRNAEDQSHARWVYTTHPQVVPQSEHYIMPEEIGELCHWLLSKENSTLVGQHIWADLGSELFIRGEHAW